MASGRISGRYHFPSEAIHQPGPCEALLIRSRRLGHCRGSAGLLDAPGEEHEHESSEPERLRSRPAHLRGEDDAAEDDDEAVTDEADRSFGLGGGAHDPHSLLDACTTAPFSPEQRPWTAFAEVRGQSVDKLAWIRLGLRSSELLTCSFRVLCLPNNMVVMMVFVHEPHCTRPQAGRRPATHPGSIDKAQDGATPRRAASAQALLLDTDGVANTRIAELV